MNVIVYGNYATTGPNFYQGYAMLTYSCSPELTTGTGNITSNPLFVDPQNGDYHLQENSPCIDAGDPASPLDPDSTCADIGCYYYHQGPVAPLTVTLTPHNPPITVPAAGGGFSLDAEVCNHTAWLINFDAWTEALLPSGSVYGPIVLRAGLVIPSGAAIMRTLTQNVPGYAPAGNYTYFGKVGIYPDSIIHTDLFTFVKLPGEGAAGMCDNWNVYGWDDDEEGFRIQDSGIGVLSVSPNPFNASTALSFKLQAASNVKLAVYNIAGREVVRLIDGYYPAGMHQVEWDASGIVSGVYFARLEAGDADISVKLLLVK